MFFIGQSGYIITLALTAFLPLFLLIANPSSGIRQQERAASGRTTHQQIQHHALTSNAVQALQQVVAIWPTQQNEWIAELEPKPKAAHIACCVVEPPQICKSNKAPPAS